MHCLMLGREVTRKVFLRRKTERSVCRLEWIKSRKMHYLICIKSVYSVDTFTLNVAKIRLEDGPHSCAGRVEVYHQQQWGTVCDDGWGIQDVAVVCKQLKCGIPLESLSGAHFGRGSGPIFLDDVNCTGTEMSIKECRGRSVGEHDCDHAEDAGAICSGNFQMREIANEIQMLVA